MDRTKSITSLMMLGLSALAFFATGCSSSKSEHVLRVGSKNFTEQVVLGEIIAQHLEQSDRDHPHTRRRVRGAPVRAVAHEGEAERGDDERKAAHDGERPTPPRDRDEEGEGCGRGQGADEPDGLHGDPL